MGLSKIKDNPGISAQAEYACQKYFPYGSE